MPAIINFQVTESNIATGAVTETKIADGAVTNAKIGAAAITPDKIHATLMQTGTANSGATGDITVAFGTAFDAVPTVFAQALNNNNDEFIVKLKTITVNGFTARLIKKNVAVASGVGTSGNESAHTHGNVVVDAAGTHDLSIHNTNNTFNAAGAGGPTIPTTAGSAHNHSIQTTTTITGTGTNAIPFIWFAVDV